jgi:hypothetical protein
MLNLAKYHREHEKFYAQAPLRTAAQLQQVSQTLKTLADRWTTVEPKEAVTGSPFAGCEDLNEKPAIQPTELARSQTAKSAGARLHLAWYRNCEEMHKKTLKDGLNYEDPHRSTR